MSLNQTIEHLNSCASNCLLPFNSLEGTPLFRMAILILEFLATTDILWTQPVMLPGILRMRGLTLLSIWGKKSFEQSNLPDSLCSLSASLKS